MLAGQDAYRAAPLVHRMGFAGPRVAAGIDVALAALRGRMAGMSPASAGARSWPARSSGSDH